MYKINTEFFDVIDSEAKAYALAWYWNRGLGRIQISKKDIDILRTLRVLLEYEGPIHIYDTTAELNITNPRFHEALSRAGCVKSKRDDQSLPIIDVGLMRHFMRGIFDSYGQIHICKSKYLNVGIVHNEAFALECRDFIRDQFEIETKHYYRYSHTTTVQFMITKSTDAHKFLSWLYGGCNYCLARKFQIWSEYLEKSV